MRVKDAEQVQRETRVFYKKSDEPNPEMAAIMPERLAVARARPGLFKKKIEGGLCFVACLMCGGGARSASGTRPRSECNPERRVPPPARTYARSIHNPHTSTDIAQTTARFSNSLSLYLL